MTKRINRNAAQSPDLVSVGLRRRYLLAAGILALSLAWSPAGLVVSADQPAASPSPATISTYLGMQVEAVYTQAARLANDLRLLYQVTRLEELNLDATRPVADASPARVILCKESAPVGTARKTT